MIYLNWAREKLIRKLFWISFYQPLEEECDIFELMETLNKHSCVGWRETCDKLRQVENILRTMHAFRSLLSPRNYNNINLYTRKRLWSTFQPRRYYFLFHVKRDIFWLNPFVVMICLLNKSVTSYSICVILGGVSDFTDAFPRFEIIFQRLPRSC